MGVISRAIESLTSPRVPVVDRRKVERRAEEIHAQTSLSSHEAVVLVATAEEWDDGDIGWLIGRSTMSVWRIQRRLRSMARENRGGFEGRVLSKL